MWVSPGFQDRKALIDFFICAMKKARQQETRSIRLSGDQKWDMRLGKERVVSINRHQILACGLCHRHILYDALHHVMTDSISALTHKESSGTTGTVVKL